MLAHYILFSNNKNLPKNVWSIDYIKQIHLKPLNQQFAIAGALIAAEIDLRNYLYLNIKNSNS